MIDLRKIFFVHVILEDEGKISQYKISFTFLVC